jgi:hypothetical protein
MTNTIGKVKTFGCPNCGGSVSVRALGISITAVCQYCSSVIDVADENLKILRKYNEKIRKTAITIGSRATLFDTEWEVIGYVVRQINIYSWEEYLLFNPRQGFRFLVCSDGHWSFVKTIHKEVKKCYGSTEMECDGKEYKLFSHGDAKVTYVMGEFYWRVKVNEKAKVLDYINPPYILSKEENNAEIVWSQGIYVEKKIIEQAFKLPSLPKPQDIAPNQPSPFDKHLPNIMLMSIFFIICLVAQQFIIKFSEEDKIIFSQTIHTFLENKGQVILSEPIELKGKKSNVEITVSSPVNNSWLELETSLTNDETQETFATLQTVEYYSGSDDEGSWSEGNHDDETIISAVPAGKYHLSLMPDVGSDMGGYAPNGLPVDFTITIKRDVPIVSNFYIALFTLLLYPIIALIKSFSFESRRWQNSDYPNSK